MIRRFADEAGEDFWKLIHDLSHTTKAGGK
jgi:hypothetical protein